MLNIIETIMIVKGGPTSGEASIQLRLGDEGILLSINKIMIDLNDGSNPVYALTSTGTAVVSGPFMDQVKELILDMFQNGLSEDGPGLYKYQDGELNNA